VSTRPLERGRVRRGPHRVREVGAERAPRSSTASPRSWCPGRAHALAQEGGVAAVREHRGGAGHDRLHHPPGLRAAEPGRHGALLEALRHQRQEAGPLPASAVACGKSDSGSGRRRAQRASSAISAASRSGSRPRVATPRGRPRGGRPGSASSAPAARWERAGEAIERPAGDHREQRRAGRHRRDHLRERRLDVARLDRQADEVGAGRLGDAGGRRPSAAPPSPGAQVARRLLATAGSASASRSAMRAPIARRIPAASARPMVPRHEADPHRPRGHDPRPRPGARDVD